MAVDTEDERPPFPKLIEKLEDALTIYSEDRRAGSQKALLAVIHYLGEDDCIDNELIQPLVGLAGAMRDAEQGIKNDHMEVGPYEGGRRKPIVDTLERAALAAFVDLFKMQTGCSVQEALRRVANKCDLSEDQLREVRKNLRKGRADPLAVRTYWFTVRTKKLGIDPP